MGKKLTYEDGYKAGCSLVQNLITTVIYPRINKFTKTVDGLVKKHEKLANDYSEVCTFCNQMYEDMKLLFDFSSDKLSKNIPLLKELDEKYLFTGIKGDKND